MQPARRRSRHYRKAALNIRRPACAGTSLRFDLRACRTRPRAFPTCRCRAPEPRLGLVPAAEKAAWIDLSRVVLRELLRRRRYSWVRDSDVKTDYLRGMEREHRTTAGTRPVFSTGAQASCVRCAGIRARWHGRAIKSAVRMTANRRQDACAPMASSG